MRLRDDPDILNVGPNRYLGSFGKASGPNHVEVAAGEAIAWESEGSDITHEENGFEICAKTSVVVDNLAPRVVGFILITFYVIAPIVYLYFVGKPVKDNLGV